MGYLKAGAVSLKYYASGWAGGSRGLVRTVETARIAGYVGFAAGEALDIFAYFSKNPDIHISGEKFGVNLGFGLLGLFGGKYGTGAAAIYFGVDAFYPKGWNGVGHDISNSWNQTINTTMQGLNQYNNVRAW